MLLAIISDIHDNLINLNKCLNWCKNNKIKKIICCGDVCNLETIKNLSLGFKGEIFLVAGNGELYKENDLKKFSNIVYCHQIGFKKINKLNISFCHESTKINTIQTTAKEIQDFIFYGHSHKPWLKKEEKTIIANPGNIAGIYFSPTFAVLDTTTKSLSLKLLNNI